MTVSGGDEYPLHQVPGWIAHPDTSDRNFYDRNYFNLHSCSDELFAIFGMGQYPNLGVHDAYLTVRKGDNHHVVRASRPLTDRLDTSVGPLRIEIIEPLKKIRFIAEPTDGSLAMDVVWDATIPAFEEPNQFLRAGGKVVFDTQRFAQTGTWTGSLMVEGHVYDVTPDTWWGCRDRSWGIRPVGEKETDGIRQSLNVMPGMWNYFPMQFDDHAIVYMCHERPDGIRPLEEAVRVWSDPDRPIDHLGRPEWEHTVTPGTRMLEHSIIRMPHADIEVTCTPLVVNYVSVGTGYGMDADWRHGMYQGPDLVVQNLTLPTEETGKIGQYGVVDHVGQFSYDGNVGYGLYEHGFFGEFPKLGIPDPRA